MDSDDIKELLKLSAVLETEVKRLNQDYTALSTRLEKISEEWSNHKHTNNALMALGSSVLALFSWILGANMDTILGWFKR